MSPPPQAARSGTRVTFWGVRGSIPACGPETVRYGGNTSCVSIERENSLIVLDAGTGIRKLGARLLRSTNHGGIEGSILLTHEHWDHIQGLPFFAPAFSPKNRFAIYGEGKGRPIADVISNQMREPYFPIEIGAFRAAIRFVEVGPGDEFLMARDIHVAVRRLDHPNKAVGYVVDVAGKRIAYVTDHEHASGSLSPTVVAMAQGADVLIHDAQYSRQQLRKGRKGWGHSAWEDVVDLAAEARVDRLFLFHHDPEADDDELDDRLRRVQQRFPRGAFAREGMTVSL